MPLKEVRLLAIFSFVRVRFKVTVVINDWPSSAKRGIFFSIQNLE